MPKAADRCFNQFIYIFDAYGEIIAKSKTKTDRILAGIASQNVEIATFCNLDISVYRSKKVGNCFG